MRLLVTCSDLLNANEVNLDITVGPPEASVYVVRYDEIIAARILSSKRLMMSVSTNGIETAFASRTPTVLLPTPGGPIRIRLSFIV